MKDYVLAAIAGAVSAAFLYPVFQNISVGGEYYKFLFIALPVLWCFGIFVSHFLKITWMRQLAKFFIVGFLNTSIDFGILNLMSMKYNVYSGLKILGVNPLSFIFALTNSFFWNKYWTFSEKTAPEAKEITKFILVAMVGVFINTGIVFLVTEYVSFDGFSKGQILNLAKVFATAFSFVWNFIGMKIFVFKEKENSLDNSINKI